MVFKSKRTIASMVTGTILGIIYINYALANNAPANGDMAAWAKMMLIFIGIAIVASIAIQIVFHIAYSVGVAVKEGDKNDKKVERIIAAETAEDEMDRLVTLKSSRVGYAIAGMGFVASLACLAFFDASAVAALNVLLGAGFVGSFTEGCMSIYLYERGA